MDYKINENLCQAKLSIIRRITDLVQSERQPGDRVVLFTQDQQTYYLICKAVKLSQ